MSNITNNNFEDIARKKILELVSEKNSSNSRIFYFGQVINNIDPNNTNRVKVRIPNLDDVFYTNNTKSRGDLLLPWCTPMSNRFIETPDNNAIVLVAVLDIKFPYSGRIFFNSFSSIFDKSLLENSEVDTNSLSNWDLIESIFGINIHSKPKNNNEFDSNPNVNYKVGIRGKSKNSLIFDKKYTELKQNNSVVFLTEKDVDINADEEINLISKSGSKEYYAPVFDDELFKYLKSINEVLKKIILVLNTTPGMSPSGPCTPSPQGKKLQSDLKSLSKEFNNFISKGSSKRIKIN